MTAETRLPKWVDPRLYSAPSPIAATGMFTRANIDAGEVVVIWGGIVIDIADYDDAKHRPRATTSYDETHYLTTPVDEPALVDEFMNHACDPNLWMRDAVTVVARRPIAAGEELTMDYACWADYDYVFTERCGCGTSLCRGTIRGFDWRIPALQERFAGHFLPYLNRRIEALRSASANVRR
jgi:uncharacterized protein